MRGSGARNASIAAADALLAALTLIAVGTAAGKGNVGIGNDIGGGRGGRGGAFAVGRINGPEPILTALPQDRASLLPAKMKSWRSIYTRTCNTYAK